MSNRIDLAKQLLRDGEFAIAKQMLGKELADPQALYLLSLLYRYDDEYDQEKTIVDKALDMDGSNAYMRERLAWHNLPIFDRVVPRQPLHLPRDPKTIPSAEVLENLCFVTGADSKYFQLMVECIESLRATFLYKDVPICVLDCGLTKDEQEYLVTKLRVKEIKDPKKTGDIPEALTGGNISLTARTVLHRIFPGYQYYFHVDADAWVHDERAIDRYLALSQKYGIGGANDPGYPEPRENMKFIEYEGCCNLGIMPDQYWNPELFKTIPFVNGGIWCFNEKYHLFDKFSQYFQECVQSKGFHYHTDMTALHLVYCAQKITEAVSVYDNYHIPKYRNHPTLVQGDMLISNNGQNIIGFVHITPNANQIGYTGTHALDVQTGQPKQVSYHYRTWPWKDKPQIREMLLKESAE